MTASIIIAICSVCIAAASFIHVLTKDNKTDRRNKEEETRGIEKSLMRLEMTTGQTNQMVTDIKSELNKVQDAVQKHNTDIALIKETQKTFWKKFDDVREDVDKLKKEDDLK